MAHHKLAPTAAMVMQWAQVLYTHETLRRFIDRLDLSSADELLARFEGDGTLRVETIRNRKHLIPRVVVNTLEASEASMQIVNLAAGMSPLILEVLLEAGDRIKDAFEIDIAGMDEKKTLYDEVAPEFASKIHCLKRDLTAEALARFHDRHHPETPTIIILEGITCYIPKETLKGIIADFKSPNHQNVFVIEYVVPFDERLNPVTRDVALRAFGATNQWSGLPETTCYDVHEMARLFSEAGGEPMANYCSSVMERLRKGRTEHFRVPEDGWAYCFVGRI